MMECPRRVASTTVPTLLLVFCAACASASAPVPAPKASEASQHDKVCEAGSADDCFELGKQLVEPKNGAASDPARAAELFRKSFDAGNAAGCSALGS